MLTKEEIESVGWNHKSSNKDCFGIDWERYEIDKKFPDIILLEPMGTYWTLAYGSYLQRGELKSTTITIKVITWGGIAGGSKSLDIYNGRIPDIVAFKQLMEWLEIK